MSQGFDMDYTRVKAFAQSKGFLVAEDPKEIGDHRLAIFRAPAKDTDEEEREAMRFKGFGIDEGQWGDMAQHIRDGKSFSVKRVF